MNYFLLLGGFFAAYFMLTARLCAVHTVHTLQIHNYRLGIYMKNRDCKKMVQNS